MVRVKHWAMIHFLFLFVDNDQLKAMEKQALGWYIHVQYCAFVQMLKTMDVSSKHVTCTYVTAIHIPLLNRFSWL